MKTTKWLKTVGTLTVLPLPNKTLTVLQAFIHTINIALSWGEGELVVHSTSGKR